jgi:hypothetical protein
VGVLALPATAIRRVNAGLIVGNPVGSTNTRAKALTSAELKAIIEASGISYLPLSGGTLTGALSIGENALTCGAITAAGNVQPEATATRSLGGSARRWSNVHSVLFTVNAISTIGANGSAQTIDIVTPPAGMRVGLSSGAVNGVIRCGAITTSGNLAIRDGLNAMQAEVFCTYTSATSFESLCLKATASAMQIGSAIGSAGGTNRPVQLGHFDAAGAFVSGLSLATNGVVTLSSTLTTSGNITGSALTAGTTSFIRFNNRSVMRSPSDGALSIANAAGTFGVLLDFSTSTLTLHDIAGTTPVSISCGAITHVPSSSVTLSTNGQFSVEMTSNTEGNLVYRGSDGTTRRMALVFA